MGHSLVVMVGKIVIGTAVGIGHGSALCGLVHVSLYDMPIEASVHEHRAFYVNMAANDEHT